MGRRRNCQSFLEASRLESAVINFDIESPDNTLKVCNRLNIHTWFFYRAEEEFKFVSSPQHTKVPNTFLYESTPQQQHTVEESNTASFKCFQIKVLIVCAWACVVTSTTTPIDAATTDPRALSLFSLFPSRCAATTIHSVRAVLFGHAAIASWVSEHWGRRLLSLNKTDWKLIFNKVVVV